VKDDFHSESIVLDNQCEKDKIQCEPQEGNVEYKYMLVNPSEERLHHLTTQLKWRVLEGSGEAIYAIGVEDDGTCKGISEQDLVSSLETLKEMSERAGCDMAMVRKQQVVLKFTLEQNDGDGDDAVIEINL